MFLGLLSTASSQDSFDINGNIRFGDSGQPVEFANIYNYTRGTGTISNSEGYFLLKDVSPGDSIIVTYIGYDDFIIEVLSGKIEYNIELKASTESLETVVIQPEDDSYLFDIILSCRKKKYEEKVYAKAYYNLESYMDSCQIEMVEGYYNIGAEAYDLDWMDLKAGRLALDTCRDRLFTSLESSRTFSMLGMMKSNNGFPLHPFNIKKRKLKKSFYLYLKGKYKDSHSDSIYIIDFDARPNRDEALFSGTAWVNITDATLKKIDYHCERCKEHPFVPIFPSDKIISVNMDISRSFGEDELGPYFKHIDFHYDVRYLSRQNKMNEFLYDIKTKALLYAYDYRELFLIPLYRFNAHSVGDFRMINAMPYNDNFWKYNEEYALNDQRQKSNVFYEYEAAITNEEIFKENPLIELGFFEHPYVKWSHDRVSIKNVMFDTSMIAQGMTYARDEYNFAVKIFLDVNQYRGETQVLSAAIFDPFESFCYLENSPRTLCLTNMYFDLCEIMRRKLHLRTRDMPYDREAIEEAYAEFEVEYDEITNRFLDEVREGYDKEEMMKWNDYIKQYLKIDNIEIFKPFEDN